jgi:hypothetical protein
MVEMSADEEKLLADGKNFEHTGGSVAASRIEVLMRAKYLIEMGCKHFREVEHVEVFHYVIFSLLVLILIFNLGCSTKCLASMDLSAFPQHGCRVEGKKQLF